MTRAPAFRIPQHLPPFEEREERDHVIAFHHGQMMRSLCRGRGFRVPSTKPGFGESKRAKAKAKARAVMLANIRREREEAAERRRLLAMGRFA